MPRIRSIHPDACKSEKLAACTPEAERCYWRLQTACDDEGRCEDHARLIWAALFPLHESLAPADVDGWLTELARVGLILRYEVDGQRVIQVTLWEKYQHPQRPSASKLPEFREGSARITGASAEESGRELGGVRVGEGERLRGGLAEESVLGANGQPPNPPPSGGPTNPRALGTNPRGPKRPTVTPADPAVAMQQAAQLIYAENAEREAALKAVDPDPAPDGFFDALRRPPLKEADTG